MKYSENENDIGFPSRSCVAVNETGQRLSDRKCSSVLLKAKYLNVSA